MFQQPLALEIPMYRKKVEAATPIEMQDIKAAIQSNFAMAEIFFQTLNVINIVQTPMFDVRTILILSLQIKNNIH